MQCTALVVCTLLPLLLLLWLTVVHAASKASLFRAHHNNLYVLYSQYSRPFSKHSSVVLSLPSTTTSIKRRSPPTPSPPLHQSLLLQHSTNNITSSSSSTITTITAANNPLRFSPFNHSIHIHILAHP